MKIEVVVGASEQERATNAKKSTNLTTVFAKPKGATRCDCFKLRSQLSISLDSNGFQVGFSLSPTVPRKCLRGYMTAHR